MKTNAVTQKCNVCGTQAEVTRDGWTVNSVVRDNGKIVYVNGKPKREIHEVKWFHLVGHMNGKHLCLGGGDL